MSDGTGKDALEHAADAHAPLVEAIAAGIAHEVRNPLNALQINLGILEQKMTEIVPHGHRHVFEMIGKIAHELRSLDNFVTEFLRFARPPRPKLEPVAVRPLLEDLVTFMGPECARKEVSLSLAVAGAPGTVGAGVAALIVNADRLGLKGVVALRECRRPRPEGRARGRGDGIPVLARPPRGGPPGPAERSG